MQENSNPNVLTVEDQKSVFLTGVKAVSAFSSQQICLELNGRKAVISGANLKITEFSKESGRFCAVGEIGGVKFVSHGSKLKWFK